MPKASARLPDVLDRLEASYGALVPTEDPVEAALLALLAAHAPTLSTEASRTRLRESFVDWNEMRVADVWEVISALESEKDASAREFARAALRFLASMHAVMNRCSFDVPPSESGPDPAALLDKMRGSPAYASAVVLAVLDRQGGWHPLSETMKAAQKLELAPKTTSTAKVAKALADAAGPEDRLRAHYLLTRYGMREKDDPDPLEGPAPAGTRRAKTATARPKAGGKSGRTKAAQ